MAIFKNQVSLNKSVAEVYQFLSSLNNHEQLMPSNVQHWSSTTDEARFTIQNMAKLSLKVDQRKENEKIVIIPAEKAPFDVKLTWKIEKDSDNTSIVHLVIDADLNMMMKMLASGPLQKLVDEQVSKLKEVLVA
ncbi:hypothetical protein SAMN05216436_102169 [bacterium A37T11]|nr:hypothetical protein SAMN05216436_102169 [bacterium A37T11]